MWRLLPVASRLGKVLAAVRAWWRQWRGQPAETEPGALALERPWLRSWTHLPKRTAGPDFRRADYAAARARAREVARATLGEALWEQLQRQGYLDVPSRLQPGLTYRLRVGQRIEVHCDPGVDSPWPWPYLCINPTYPLPEEEFFAHLYLYVRDNEEHVRRVAAPQPWDQVLGRTF
ncbi:MAG: hypothetical protein ETSY1_14000 [Candidatus Entotheonella factor]|uniref:Uncharacterized protein n=1 Tax=Entotheonella factor TaxID=1429438 RepID=W4LPB0_ENTF1|nr:MAG: hypothetical protein ETSY1_14000 [Candidatus Entotheonella factor]